MLNMSKVNNKNAKKRFNNRNARKRCERCSELTVKTQEQRQ